MSMPDALSDERPGVAVIIASKRKPSKPDESTAAEEMAEEIMEDIKSEDAAALGKSLMNFVRYVIKEQE